MSHDQLQTAALTAVAAACDVARAVQRDVARVQRITKDDKSPVTVADFAVQAVVALSLREALTDSVGQIGNDVHIAGEEYTEALRTAEQSHVLEAVIDAVRSFRPTIDEEQVLAAIDACNHDATASAYWTLDPVDGTKGFLRGQQYAIALARIEHGRVVQGVMGCPNLPLDHEASLDRADSQGVMYSAMIGAGAWEHRLDDRSAKPRRIRAAAHEPGQPIRACESVESSHSRQDDTARILQELGGAAAPARLDSQCKYAVVARGQADVYLRLPTGKAYVEKIWDHAAGMIIAQEAGAVVSDINGRALDFTHGRVLARNRGIVCAAAGLHRRVIDAIEELRIGAPA